MHYKPKDYVRALMDAIRKRPEREDHILKNFVGVLALHRDFKRWRRIEEIFERTYLAECDKKSVNIYLARENEKYRQAILQLVPRDAHISFLIDPSIVGGVKILLNKELLIDGSAQRRIRKLFNREN